MKRQHNLSLWCKAIRDHRAYARARKQGNANSRLWQPQEPAVRRSVMRACEPSQRKQTKQFASVRHLVNTFLQSRLTTNKSGPVLYILPTTPSLPSRREPPGVKRGARCPTARLALHMVTYAGRSEPGRQNLPGGNLQSTFANGHRGNKQESGGATHRIQSND